MPEGNVTQRLRELVEDTDRLWERPDVGPPPELEAGETLGELLQLWMQLLRVWEPFEHRDARTQHMVLTTVDHELEEALSTFAHESLTVWNSFNGLVRRLSPKVQEESLVDELINVTVRACDATADAWALGGPAGMPQERYDRARVLRGFVNSIADTEDIRRVKARAQVAIASVEATARSAQVSLETQREAVGETGSLSLSTHFSDLAKAESKRADLFLAAAIAVVVAFIVIVAFFVPHTDVTVTELISRAIIAIPGFGLAAYLAREGGRHRHVAQWAKSLEVQLKTVDAFAAPMTTADVSEVRKAFASRAFGAMPAIPGRQSGSDSPAPVDLQAIIERLITELRAKGPGPS